MASPACWICLEGGRDERDGKPLVRGCACRGSAGHAHVSCIADFARSKSDAADAAAASNERGTDAAKLLASYRKHWMYCPTCGQGYFGEVALSIAQKMEEYTAPLDKEDYRKILSRLTLGIAYASIGNNSNNKLSAEIYVEVLRTLHGVKYECIGPAALVYQLLEIEACMCGSEVLGNLGRYSQAQNLLKGCITRLSSVPAFTPLIDTLRAKADRMGSLAQGDNDREGAVELARREYELALDTHPNSLCTLICQRDLVLKMAETTQVEEAISLARELVEKADRVLGKDHQSAKSFRTTLEMVESAQPVIQAGKDKGVDGILVARIVGLPAFKMNGRSCTVQKRTKDDKYLVLIRSGSDNRVPQKFKAKPENLVFPPETPVILDGLVSASHLNRKAGTIVSYDEDKQRYGVNIEGERNVIMSVRQKNVVVTFAKSEIVQSK